MTINKERFISITFPGGVLVLFDPPEDGFETFVLDGAESFVSAGKIGNPPSSMNCNLSEVFNQSILSCQKIVIWIVQIMYQIISSIYCIN